ncbi:pilus (MSHA type) biogenesis protein MshL [Candidatus Deferrimicrobium sp.]|uniref:pilus (MSHA type) biogenesis protein MshL n=1 Tax=Candidatus Deferrimicrobium sp. TaxID=3060586 RepID=UPI00271ED47E|nr:pilus (MSHA type) biogenesis protein MshL [Candidatus Deferrimicrobium sp.]MDO8737817.1 secretin N-terminal domain-containing protein [Candidatus Deferrimicrobium sp.]
MRRLQESEKGGQPLKTLAVALIGMTAMGIGCAKAHVVRKSPPPPVAVSVASAAPAAKPAPAARPAPLPDAPLEGVERTRSSSAEFRKPARRYTLVMAGADARELFLSLARENDFNLVLSPEVSGTVTMDIKEATAEELMDEVCGMLGCRAVFGGKTVRVAPEKRVTRVFPVDYLLTGRTGAGSLMASTSASGGGGGGGGSTTTSESQSTNSVTTEEKADFWGGLAEEIGALLSPGGGKVVVNRTSGTVTVTDYMANVEQVERHLRMIEARVRTGVVIETRIMEVTLDDSTKYGINWTALPDLSSLSLSGSLTGGATAAQGLSTGSTTFQLGVAGSKFNAFLDALAQAGNLNVLSAPKVSTLNNQKAIIRIGRQDVFFRAVITPASTTSAAFTTYTPDSVTEGIILSVTPQVGQDGRIMLAIHPTITEKVGEAVAPDKNTAPILDVRETNTVVTVADGETVFIGGMMQERTQETVKSVPLLGDIPYLGALFRSNEQIKKKTELVILISPRIVRIGEGGEMAAREQERLRNLQRGHHLGGRPQLYGVEGEWETLRPWN